MVRIQDIRSLTDFHRYSKQHLKRLRRTGRPEVLTVNGEARVVVQDAGAYERLLEKLHRAEARAGQRDARHATDRDGVKS